MCCHRRSTTWLPVCFLILDMSIKVLRRNVLPRSATTGSVSCATNVRRLAKRKGSLPYPTAMPLYSLCSMVSLTVRSSSSRRRDNVEKTDGDTRDCTVDFFAILRMHEPAVMRKVTLSASGVLPSPD